MQKKLSRSEELAQISLQETEQFLEEKINADHERSTHIADLKAQRLAKEKKAREAQKKFAQAVLNK